MDRPFYNSFAWAYDEIIGAPFAQRCDFIQSELNDYEIRPGALVLDAGCGTGGYAVELAKRGYHVQGFDLSPSQIAEANKKITGNGLPIEFKVADFLKLSNKNRFDLILCRGVLNDLIDDESRQRALDVFAQALIKKSVLIFDVRHWERSAKAKTISPFTEREFQTEHGLLKFRSECKLDYDNRLLLIHERHSLVNGDKTESANYDLLMRCWTEHELEECLVRANLQIDALYGDYDRLVLPDGSEKMVIVARPRT